MAVCTIHRRVARQLGLRMFAVAASTQPIVAAATDVSLQPNAKKVPKSGYHVFMADPDIKGKVGQGSVAELSKKIAGLWSKLPDAEKQKYKDQSVKLQKDFAAAGGAPAAKLKKQSKATTSTRPPSAYNNFMKAVFADVKKEEPNAKATEIVKKIAVKWNKLSDTEKKRYAA